jgi:hypothetical protein
MGWPGRVTRGVRRAFTVKAENTTAELAAWVYARGQKRGGSTRGRWYMPARYGSICGPHWAAAEPNDDLLRCGISIQLMSQMGQKPRPSQPRHAPSDSNGH